MAWFTVPRAHFSFVRGAPVRFRSSAKGTRTFCPRCGTQLTFEHDDLVAEIDVTTCSIDAPEDIPPRDHTWTTSRLRWVKLADDLPQFAGPRNER